MQFAGSCGRYERIAATLSLIMKIQDLPFRKAATLSALVIGAFFAVVAVAFAAKHSADKYLVYVGTYTGPKSKGIYGLRFDPGTGRLEQIGLVGEVESPSFLTLNPAQNYLYAISEISGKTNGFVSSFSLLVRHQRNQRKDERLCQ